jgi:hypothetical protein
MISQGRRRGSVLLLFLGYGSAVALALWPRVEREVVWSVLLGALGLVALLGLFGLLRARRVLIQGSGVLDERQRGVRDRAYFVAYRFLSAVASVVAVYLCLAGVGWISALHLTGTAAVLLAGGMVLLSLTLPSAIIAWTEPDPPEDSGAYSQVNRTF